MKLLGTVITSDLKWETNTEVLVRKANAGTTLLTKIAEFNPPKSDLKTIYILFIRSLLEQSAVVWHSSLTKENSDDLERVQKSAVKVILNNQYKDYESALERLEIQKLKDRRELLCKNFANKCIKN